MKRQSHINLAGWSSLAELWLPVYTFLVAAAPASLQDKATSVALTPQW